MCSSAVCYYDRIIVLPTNSFWYRIWKKAACVIFVSYMKKNHIKLKKMVSAFAIVLLNMSCSKGPGAGEAVLMRTVLLNIAKMKIGSLKIRW